MTDKGCFKKRRLPADQIADENDVKAESGFRAEHCDSSVHPPYQLTSKVDGRPVAFELVTGVAVTFINEKYMPRSLRLIPVKSMVRSYRAIP